MYSNAFNCQLSSFDKFRKLNFRIQYCFTSNYLLKPNFANLCRTGTLCKVTDQDPIKYGLGSIQNFPTRFWIWHYDKCSLSWKQQKIQNQRKDLIFPSCKTVLKKFQRCIWILRIRKMFYLFDKMISIAGFISSKELRINTCTILKAYSCSLNLNSAFILSGAGPR